MAQLDHDPSTGFLRGESIADEVEQLAQELKLLRAIESNTSDIARRLAALSLASAPVKPEPAGINRAPIISQAMNDPAASQSPSSAQGLDSARRQREAGRDDRPAVSARQAGAREGSTPNRQLPTEKPRQPGARDESGRFSKSGNPTGQNSSEVVASTTRSIGGAIANAARDISNKMTSDVDNVDPAIQAAKEVSGILSPASALFKPFGRLFGRDKDVKQTKEHRESIGWLRRIWRGQADANKAKGRGGLMGMLGMLLALVTAALAPFKALGRLLGLGGLLKAAGGLMSGMSGRRGRRGVRAQGRERGSASQRGRGRDSVRSRTTVGADGSRAEPGNNRSTRNAGAATGAGRGASTAARASSKGLGGSLMGIGKGALRKLPFIGALLGAGMIASDAMAGDDPDLSREDNKKQKWGNVGGGVGGLVGGVLGLVGGPAGAVAGGILGDMVGSKVGEWLSTVDFDSVMNTISTTFSGLADTASKAASDAFDYVKEGWSGLVTAGTKAFSGMVDWARDAWKSVTDKVANWKDTAADAVQNVSDRVGEQVNSVRDSGSNLLYRASGGRFGTGGSAAAKEELIKAMDAGGITDPKSKAMLMANVDHESGGFTKNEENLNYSAKRLQQVFPKYYKTAEAARADAGNPEAIANRVYGGRMGNTEAGDGYKYRGRGALQLTGKAQYEAMGRKLGVDLVNNPELAADPKYSAQIAVQHWKSSGADRLAQAGDIEGARRRTNGGTNGLGDVEAKYKQTYLAQAMAGDLTPTRRADELRVQAPESVSSAVATTMATMEAGTSPVGVLASPRARQGAASNSAPTILAPTPIGVLARAQPRAATPGALAGNSATTPATPLAPGQASRSQASRNPAGATAATSIGLLAPTAPRSAAMANSAIPATLAMPQVRSYAPVAADASQMRVPSVSEVKAPLGGGGGRGGQQSITVELPLSQNVSDRGIAHASAGGLGMSPI